MHGTKWMHGLRGSWALGALVALLWSPAGAAAQVYVQGGAQVQGQVAVQGGYAPAQPAPAPAPMAGTTAGTVQGRGGFIGGELTFPQWLDSSGLGFGLGLQLRWGWELPSGLMPHIEVGGMSHVISGTDATFNRGWLNLGGRWAFYNSSAFAPFVGAGIELSGFSVDAGGYRAESDRVYFGIELEGGLLMELSKFWALTGALRYVRVFGDAASADNLGLGFGAVVFY